MSDGSASRVSRESSTEGTCVEVHFELCKKTVFFQIQNPK